MNSQERFEFERVKALLAHWKSRHDAVKVGGVLSSAKAIFRLQRKNDLKMQYILAAEKFIDALEEHHFDLTTTSVRQAWNALLEHRRLNGVGPKPEWAHRHAPEECHWEDCKLPGHRDETTGR